MYTKINTTCLYMCLESSCRKVVLIPRSIFKLTTYLIESACSNLSMSTFPALTLSGAKVMS